MNIVTILKNIGAVLTDDHFVYTSGKHGSVYINKDALYPHTVQTSMVGSMFAKKFAEEDIDVVAAPAVGGTILSQWTAYHLTKLKRKEVLSVYTEKDKGTLASASESPQILRRGYGELVKGKRVLVVEDLTTTGLSVQKTVKAVENAGGTVVAVCVMINRDPHAVTSASVGAPFSSLGVIRADAVQASDCQLCKAGKPINTSVGHGKAYLEQKAKA